MIKAENITNGLPQRQTSYLPKTVFPSRLNMRNEYSRPILINLV